MSDDVDDVLGILKHDSSETGGDIPFRKNDIEDQMAYDSNSVENVGISYKIKEKLSNYSIVSIFKKIRSK